MAVVKLDTGRYAKNCTGCGEQQTYLRKNYADASLREGKDCKKCANSKAGNSHRGWYRGIRISWFNKFETNAKLRGIVWAITLDDVADLYKEQEALCALTGWDITFPEVGHPQMADASIDRVDSQFGYIPENIQLVNKKVDMMKQAYSQEEFIELCKAVADKAKW